MKLFFKLFLSLLVSLVICSCSSNNDEPTVEPPLPEQPSDQPDEPNQPEQPEVYPGYHIPDYGPSGEVFYSIITLTSNADYPDQEVAEITGARECDFILIPDSIETEGKKYPVGSISEDAFKGHPVKYLVIPPTLTRIGTFAFEDTHVEELYISDLTSWCNILFEYKIWSGTTGTSYESYANPLNKFTNFYVKGEKISGLVIPESITNLNSFVFSHLNCESVTLNDNISEIPMEAFSGCLAKKFKTGKGLEQIDDDAMSYMYNLTDLYLYHSSSVIYFSLAFLRPITTPTRNLSLHIDSIESFLNIYWGYNVYGNDPYTPFGYYDLYLTDITPLTEIVTPEGLNKLGAYALAGSRIRRLVCSEGIEKVDYMALTWMPNLESISFPATLEELATDFRECDNLREITVSAINPPVYNQEHALLSSSPYDPLKSQCILYVPKGSVEAYRDADFWGDFEDIREIEP